MEDDKDLLTLDKIPDDTDWELVRDMLTDWEESVKTLLNTVDIINVAIGWDTDSQLHNAINNIIVKYEHTIAFMNNIPVSFLMWHRNDNIFGKNNAVLSLGDGKPTVHVKNLDELISVMKHAAQ
jgi:hypothetical protein